MAGLTLKSLLRPKSSSAPAVTALLKIVGVGISIVDPEGKPLLGTPPEEISTTAARIPVQLDDVTLGYVLGPAEPANAAALLLAHFAARESEARALASEVLHLYREFNLIEQLSEQLVALLNSSAVAESSLAQAQRLITATHGSVLIFDKEGGTLACAASFGDALRRSPQPRIALRRLHPRARHRRNRQRLRRRSARPRLHIRTACSHLCASARRPAHRRCHRSRQQ